MQPEATNRRGDHPRQQRIESVGLGAHTAARPDRKVTIVIKMIITLKRREGMTHDEFTHYQRKIHRPMLLEIPEWEKYVRRFVVSYPVPAPRYPEPDYDSVVEAWFDSMEDLEALFFSENFL